MNVILADLFCRGDEHLEFNTCLIETVACDADHVVVFAEEGLIRKLKAKLVSFGNIDYHSYSVFLPKTRICNYFSFFFAFIRYFFFAFKSTEYRKILLGMDVFVQPCCLRGLAMIGQLRRVVNGALLHHQMPRFVRAPQLQKLYDGLSEVNFYTITCGGVDLFNQVMNRSECRLLPHPLYPTDRRPVRNPEGPVKVFTFGKHAKSILEEGALERYIEYTSHLIVDDYEVHLYLKGEGLSEARSCEGIVVHFHDYTCHLSCAEYNQLFLDHDLFWMSASIDYKIRASGVVFDAIRFGCFVVDPRGEVLSSNVAEIADVQSDILSSIGGVRRGADFQIRARQTWDEGYESAVREMLER